MIVLLAQSIQVTITNDFYSFLLIAENLIDSSRPSKEQGISRSSSKGVITINGIIFSEKSETQKAGGQYSELIWRAKEVLEKSAIDK